jgi:hypothetical protein
MNLLSPGVVLLVFPNSREYFIFCLLSLVTNGAS